VYSGGLESSFRQNVPPASSGYYRRSAIVMRFLYGLQETFPSARTAMPVPVPTEPRVQSTGVLFWAEGDHTHSRLLAEVKGVWSRTSPAPCMLS